MSKRPIRLDDDREPWDRQPGETHRQYSRFRTFLELGRGRTLKQTAEMLQAVGDTVSYRVLQQYGYQFQWTVRAEAHDYDQDRLERERLLTLRREMTGRHRKLAAGLTSKAVAAMQNLQPGDLSTLDIVRFIETAARLERAALGGPDQTVALTGPGGDTPVAVEDFSRYTPEERKVRLTALRDEIGRRLGAMGPDEDDDD